MSSSVSSRPAGLTSDRMLKLMAYADGELEGAELEEVEDWLATDVDAVRFANELAGLGDLVAVGHQASADAKAVASFDVADAVMAAVSAEKQERPKAAPVVSLEARRQKNFRAGAMVAAALALAASVVVAMRSKKDEAPLARAPIPVEMPSPLASAEPGVDVDLVETAGESVRVFYLSSESSPTTSVVVWVDESGGK
jgi:anti-sigma factor RsiW